MTVTVQRISHSIGFTKVYAICRDEAKKRIYYGAKAEIFSDKVRYFLPSGEVVISVDNQGIAVQVVSAESQFPTRFVNAVVRPLKISSDISFSSLPCKIFGTGLGRTGTTSLFEALSVLGVFGIHHAPYIFPAIKKDPHILRELSEYDAYIDSPFSFCYELLDNYYPDSKFIHTRRNVDSWLQSIEWLIGNSSTSLSRWFYGVDYFDQASYKKKFIQHENQLYKFFEKRPDDLLILDLDKDTGWEKLCHFVGKPMPDVPYPSSNPRSGSASSLAKMNVRLD